MTPKEQRQYEKDERARLRNNRLLQSKQRQGEADDRVYGEDSSLRSTQSSAKGDGRGGIWDVSTSTYEPTKNNQTGTLQTINDAGIDSIKSNASELSANSGDGLPDFPGEAPSAIDGYLIYDDSNDEVRWSEEITSFQVVKDDNTVGEYSFAAKEII